MAEVKSYKVLSLPSRPSPDSIYWVKGSSASDVIGFITDRNGVPYPLKDLQGSGGITTLTNTDGNLVIIGADNKVINIAPALLSVINSALQSGANISELVNDEGFITVSDIPTNVSDFTNDAGYLISETDPIFQASEASLFVVGDKANLDNQSGINSGDETTSSIQTKRPLKTINLESLEGTGNIQIDYNDLDNLPAIPTVPSFADQTETNAGVVTNKTISPNTLAGWWTYQKGLIQTFAQKITFSLGALFTPQATPTHERGRVYFDDSNDCLAYMDSVSGTSVQIGQEMIMRVRNNTGATILNGSVVYVSGAIGQNSTIALAQANTMPTSEIIGIATHDIANNTIGKVCVFGQVNDLDTSDFSDGNAVFLSSSVAGRLVVTPPVSPNFVVAVGVVEHAHPTQGKILVRPQRALANNNSLGTSQSISATQNAVKTANDLKQDILVSATNIKTINGNSVLGSGNLTISGSSNVVTEINTTGTASSGTSETITYSVLIPANTVDVGVYDSVFRTVRSSGSGAHTLKLYLNSIDSLSGASLVGQVPSTATARYMSLQRFINVKIIDGTGLGTEVANIANLNTASNDYVQHGSTTGLGNIAIDWTTDVYLIATITASTGTDSFYGTFLILRK